MCLHSKNFSKIEQIIPAHKVISGTLCYGWHNALVQFKMFNLHWSIKLKYILDECRSIFLVEYGVNNVYDSFTGLRRTNRMYYDEV